RMGPDRREGVSQGPRRGRARRHFRRGHEPIEDLPRDARRGEKVTPGAPLPEVNPAGPAGECSRRFAWLWQLENLLVALALVVLMLLPLIEIAGRKLFHGGLSGSAAFQQHLVLIIGLLGGMFAARDRRLLSLSTLTNFLKGRWQAFARIFS